MKRERLKKGGDYVNLRAGQLVINRTTDGLNCYGFVSGSFHKWMTCTSENVWVPASRLIVIKAFLKEIHRRFGKDWRTAELDRQAKQEYPGKLRTNGLGVFIPTIGEMRGDNGEKHWVVWNENGRLFSEGEWAEPKKH